MKFKIKKNNLCKALQATTGVTVHKDLNPILENVLLKTTPESFAVYATNLAISLSYFLPSESIEVTEQGALLAPAQKLYNLLREIPDSEVLMEREDNNLWLISADGKVKILGEAAEKFPEIPQFSQNKTFKISHADLRKLIKKTLFATTTEKTRYDLDNVLALVEDNKIQFVATDGKRLALAESPCENPSNLSMAVTIPKQGLQQVDRLLAIENEHSDPTVIIETTENQMLFKTDQAVLSTRLSEGKFPPYEKVIPSESNIKIGLKVKDLTSALRRIILMTDEREKIVEMRFESQKLHLSASNLRYGEAYLEMEVEYEGDPIEIKFNPDFFMDMLKVVDSPKISLGLNDPYLPGLITDGMNFKYVILPIRPQKNSSM